MLENKTFFYIALIFFLMCMVLAFPYPNEYSFGESIAPIFHIPVHNEGWQYIGIAWFVFLVTGFIFLGKSLQKYHARFALLAFVITLLLPGFVAEAYQKTLGSGIYAVHYDKEWSQCTFDMKEGDNSKLYGVCELPFENYSGDTVEFTLEFREKLEEQEPPMMSLLNEEEPIVVKLVDHEKKIVRVEKVIDVSKAHIYGGDAMGVDILIKTEEKSREL